MKFEYNFDKDDPRKPSAILYEFNGGPELCLAIDAQEGKTVWLYHNSLPSIQRTDPYKTHENAVKKFYPGDKITITF
jgi:hypothetical protein